MNKKYLVILISLFLFYGCSKSGSSYSSTTTPPPVSNDVSISGMSFSSITIKAGATVTWTNLDNVIHTVTADDGSWGSANLAKGDKFNYTFPSAGTFPYHCKIHSNMTSSVVVQ